MRGFCGRCLVGGLLCVGVVSGNVLGCHHWLPPTPTGGANGDSLSGECDHFLEMLTLYGVMVVVGLCIGIFRLWASCMACCNCDANV